MGLVLVYSKSWVERTSDDPVTIGIYEKSDPLIHGFNRKCTRTTDKRALGVAVVNTVALYYTIYIIYASLFMYVSAVLR